MEREVVVVVLGLANGARKRSRLLWTVHVDPTYVHTSYDSSKNKVCSVLCSNLSLFQRYIII